MRRLGWWLVVLPCALAILSVPCRAQSPDESAAPVTESRGAEDEQPSPEKLLRRMADYLAGLPAVSCRMDMLIHIQASGMDNRMTTKAAFRLQRPRRFAMILEEGFLGMTIVCDGQHLTQYMPTMNSYTTRDAPEDLAALPDSVESLGMMSGLSEFGFLADGERFYDQLMEGVTESKYLGTDEVGGVACHHCRFVQKEMQWDIWIENGDRPIVHKVVPDMSSQLAEMGATMQNATMEISLTFTDWNTAPDVTDADFSFTPPEGAEQVESFFGSLGGGEEEGPHPLLGEPAPTFETVDLEGQPVKLQDYLAKNVVILDFWATWCGPCVEALPIVASVADKFKDRGVVFYTVNLGDDVETISEFLQEHELQVPVATDIEGDVGDLYQADAIPQTVLIGTDGKVQVVHVGYGEGLEGQLSTELDDLLVGKDLASITLAEAEKKRQERLAGNELLEPAGTTSAWTVAGRWTGVAVDAASSTVYAVGPAGKAVVVDAAGTTQRALTLADGGTSLRLANLVGDADQELVTFESWGSSVRAFGADGTPLWSYPGGQGIDDVWAADLNGDGRDEIVVGYNGSTGLHVLDHRGTLLWKNTDLGNVWHVSAGDFNGDGAPEVITTSAAGALHVFDADGAKLKDIDPSIYANMVRMAAADGGNAPAGAVVAGSGDDGEVLLAVSFDGNEKWSIALPALSVDHVDDAAVAGSVPWAAVAMRGGLVHVVDLDTGRLVARVAEQGATPQLAWLPRNDASPLLIVATGRSLGAFEITPTDLTTEGAAAATTADAEQGEADATGPAADSGDQSAAAPAD